MIIRALLQYYLDYGDSGAGLRASHPTDWTGLVAKFLQLFGFLDAEQALAGGKLSAFQHGTQNRTTVPSTPAQTSP